MLGWLWRALGFAKAASAVAPDDVHVSSTGKLYLEGGPPDDPTPIWRGPFPLPDHVEPIPDLGMMCTITDGTVLRRARIVGMNPSTLLVAPEYGQLKEFSLRADGTWRDKHFRGKKGARLVIGAEASNFRLYKLWYTPKEAAGGWII